jgi:hypothetical protein
MLLVESGELSWSRTFLAEILRELIHRSMRNVITRKG